MSSLPELIAEAQTTEERFLRQIFVRDQMAEWSKHPLIMARAEGVHYWDVAGKRYLDGLSGIYVAALGHGNRRVIEAMRSNWTYSASRRRCTARTRRPYNLPTCSRSCARRSLDREISVRRLGSDRGRNQTGTPISPAPRESR